MFFDLHDESPITTYPAVLIDKNAFDCIFNNFNEFEYHRIFLEFKTKQLY